MATYEKYGRVLFTADWHLYHKNVIEYCDRPFKSMDEMMEVLITNYTFAVAEADLVFWLGDITLKENNEYKPYISKIIRSLPGKKILVRGNHDKYKQEFYKDDCGFLKVVKRIETEDFTLVHTPDDKFVKFTKGKTQIHGHNHRKEPLKYKSYKRTFYYDVGVDGNDFMPISIYDIKRSIKLFKSKGIRNMI